MGLFSILLMVLVQFNFMGVVFFIGGAMQHLSTPYIEGKKS